MKRHHLTVGFVFCFLIDARNNGLKLVFLWFGSWKNSMSSHAPAWVKLNQEKYHRVKDATGRSQEMMLGLLKA